MLTQQIHPPAKWSINTINFAFFDDLSVKTYFPEIDGFTYPKGLIMTNYPEKDYLNQYWDLKLFYKEYIGSQILSPIIIYEKRKT